MVTAPPAELTRSSRMLDALQWSMMGVREGVLDGVAVWLAVCEGVLVTDAVMDAVCSEEERGEKRKRKNS